MIKEHKSNDELLGNEFLKEKQIELSARQFLILELIHEDNNLTSEKMSEKPAVTTRTIERDIALLKRLGILHREGGRKERHWVIITE
ncbi:HTH domain-containing protein [Prevotella sp.]|uniref:HTH domain-containing protein n=1 Tax=Prevotella sp. TaxID=59823 RepID=UPI003DA6B4AF